MPKTRFDVIREDNEVTPVAKPKRFPVVCQQWEESEASWGVRPDGYSLHLTEADREAYVTQFWAEERKRNPSRATPAEYTRECGTPYLVDVDQETYDKIAASLNGLSFSGSAPKGAKSGWVSVP
jgi:hypothetical protein